jgi:hypothetical protein
VFHLDLSSHPPIENDPICPARRRNGRAFRGKLTPGSPSREGTRRRSNRGIRARWKAAARFEAITLSSPRGGGPR